MEINWSDSEVNLGNSSEMQWLLMHLLLELQFYFVSVVCPLIAYPNFDYKILEWLTLAFCLPSVSSNVQQISEL